MQTVAVKMMARAGGQDDFIREVVLNIDCTICMRMLLFWMNYNAQELCLWLLLDGLELLFWMNYSISFVNCVFGFVVLRLSVLETSVELELN